MTKTAYDLSKIKRVKTKPKVQIKFISNYNTNNLKRTQ